MARRHTSAAPRPRPGLPAPEALIEFLRANPGALGGREIARAFRLGRGGRSRGGGGVGGVFRRPRGGGGGPPADRRDKGEYQVLGHDAVGLADDELVVAEELPSRRFGKRVRIIERLGPANAPGAISRVTIAAFEIPTEFPPAARPEPAAARPAPPTGRADLRA